MSVYPVSAKLVAPRELFHGIYLPRDQTSKAHHFIYFHEALDNACWFSLNHFVPLCFRATPIKANMPNDKPPQVKRKTEDETSSGKKKTKLESFWGQTKKKEPHKEKTAEKLTKESFFSKFAGFKKKTEEKEVTNMMKEEKEVAMLSEKKGATKKIEEEQVTKKTEEEDVMEEKKKSIREQNSPKTFLKQLD